MNIATITTSNTYTIIRFASSRIAESNWTFINNKISKLRIRTNPFKIDIS